MRDGVTDLHFNGTFDSRDDISYTSARNLLTRMHLHLQHTDLICHIFFSGADELDLVAGLYGTVDNLEIGNDTTEGIEHRVEDKRLKRSLRITFRSRNPFHYGIKNFLHALTGLSGSEKNLFLLAAQQVCHLIGNDIDHCRFHINLVEDRNDLEIMLNGKVKVGYGLGLNTLGCINYKDGTLA